MLCTPRRTLRTPQSLRRVGAWTTLLVTLLGCGDDGTRVPGSNSALPPAASTGAGAPSVGGPGGGTSTAASSGGTTQEPASSSGSATGEATTSSSSTGGAPVDGATTTGAPATTGGASSNAGTTATDPGTSGVLDGGLTGGSTPTTAGDAAAPPDDAMQGMPESVLPPIDDPAEPGPFGVERIDRVSGLDTHSLFVPDSTGLHGKYPVAVWTNGNGGRLTSLSYASFVEHVASHGFFVIADKASNGSREAEVDSQKAAITWVLAENERSGGPYFEKIDVDRIAVMGHSLGSLASFATAASDDRVKTSVHFSGGITDNPVGFDPDWLNQMTRPAAFLCGGSDNTAGPSCAKDFEGAPIPVFYGVLARASHIGPFASSRGGEYGRAGVAWLRWQLADDPAFRSWFVGSDCVLCSSPWSAMQRDLE